MKNISMHRHTLKLIFSHALLVAIVTMPSFIALITDLYVIATNKTHYGIGFPDENMYASMQLLSGISLLIAAIAAVLYFISKKRLA